MVACLGRSVVRMRASLSTMRRPRSVSWPIVKACDHRQLASKNRINNGHKNQLGKDKYPEIKCEQQNFRLSLPVRIRPVDQMYSSDN